MQCKSIERALGIPHLSGGMTYKEFYAQAMLSSLPIAYAVEKDGPGPGTDSGERRPGRFPTCNGVNRVAGGHRRERSGCQ